MMVYCYKVVNCAHIYDSLCYFLCYVYVFVYLLCSYTDVFLMFLTVGLIHSPSDFKRL
jgi:hypothetical protein